MCLSAACSDQIIGFSDQKIVGEINFVGKCVNSQVDSIYRNDLVDADYLNTAWF